MKGVTFRKRQLFGQPKLLQTYYDQNDGMYFNFGIWKNDSLFYYVVACCILKTPSS